ncbi:right-handed parallel beta-helix repeat-containing protein [Oceanobacillus sp. CFH 90083]|uniref:right-handed parallel beta-helix repeat-containing protein n=1 Tax=Oceanobacillus sp. CFH 90083 TaxID=2592336 RepID=UPI001883FEAC|nr:right-handed parallel beta-helix repeat-containing protein [Oceanobacillus sp. CFH 90083]
MKDSVVVKKGGLFNKYRTIQQGIEAVIDGGTVYIEGGEYKENLVLDGRDITLIGKGSVVISGTKNIPLIKTVDAKLSLQGISFQQEGHTNAIYVKETSEVKMEDCQIEGENYQDVKTTYPALWVGLESKVHVKNSTLIGHTSNSLHVEESVITLEGCNVKGFGIYACLGSKLTAEKLTIKNPSSYGIFAKEAELDLKEISMTGGGVAVILEDNSKGYINTLSTNHTYRDVLRVNHSELTVEKAEMKNFCEIKKKDKKAGYPAVYITNNSVVKLDDVHIQDSLFDGIQVYQSQLEASNTFFKKLFMGIYIRKQSAVKLENIKMTQLEYNAVSAGEQSNVIIRNSLFDHCVDEHEKNYPVIFMKEQGSLHLEGTSLKGSLHDAVYLDDVQSAYLDDVTFDAVNTGVYVQKSILNANQLTIKNCYKNAVIIQDGEADIRNSYLENNNLNSSPTYEANSDIPKAVDAAIFIANARVALDSIEVIDKTASISLRERSSLHASSLQLSGGIFSMDSVIDMTFLTFRNIEKEPVHFKLLAGTDAKVQFNDPSVRAWLEKDKSSRFSSNLIHSPHMVIPHYDIAGKAPGFLPVNPVVPFEKEKKEAQLKEKESMQIDSLIGPTAYKESMKKLLKEITIYKIRSAQGISMNRKWKLLWLQKGMDDLTPFFEQTQKLLTKAGVIKEGEYFRLSEMTSLSNSDQINSGLLWIDQLNGIEYNTNLRALLEDTFSNQELVIIISGKASEINVLKSVAPKLLEQISDETVFDFYTAEEIAEMIYQKLVEHQFVFDSAYLKEAIKNHYPILVNERVNQWPEEMVKAIIQAQSDRLLEQQEVSLEKEQIISLTQTDILTGVMAVK